MAKSRTRSLGTDRSLPVTAVAALLQGLLDGPSFGLDLIKRIKHKTQGQVSLLRGTVYLLLQRLAERGWLQDHACYRASWLMGERTSWLMGIKAASDRCRD